MADDRPNIILVIDDQHRGDCLGCDGHPVLKTPVLDMLAAQGTRFSRGYTTIPSCIPARRALLCGQFPATNGMVGFGGDPDWRPAFTLPGELSRAGYHTFHVGRTMHQAPFRKRLGFDHMVLQWVHNPVDGEYERMLQGRHDIVDDASCHGYTWNGYTAGPWPLADHEHYTNWTINEALRFLNDRDPSCPFFLNVSLFAPHPPLVPPRFYMDRYLKMDLPQPVIGDWATPPPPCAATASVDSYRVNLTGEILHNCLAGYFGLINHIDDQLMRLLRPRIQNRFDGRNTMIIFVSDHGEMLGDHYLFRKCQPFEASARIPFIIRGSDMLGFKEGQVFDRPVCLEDLLPTCLDLAGAPIPAGVDGRSLLPILRGEKVNWRPWLHGEHAPCYGADQAYHSLTDGHWKYIWRPLDGRELLFDLCADPQECKDLSKTSEHAATLKQWRDILIEHLRDRPEGFSDGGRLIAGRPYRTMLSRN